MKLICILLAISLGAIYAEGQPYRSMVKGRIVDAVGKPVANAKVSLESVSENEIDIFTYSQNGFTDVNGEFRVENISTAPIRKRQLWAIGPFADDAMDLFDLPPYRSFLRSYPGLRVSTVNLHEKDIKDIGEVQLGVYQTVVEVALLRDDGRPFFSSQRDWRSIYVVLRDKVGEIYAGTGISTFDSDSHVELGGRTIRLNIPTGTWRIEFVSDLDDLTSIFAKTELFTIRGGSEMPRIKLSVRASSDQRR